MAAAHDIKPRFHIAPPQGWINDPNGPIFYKGYYHMFYQYVETGCTWSWGLMWGHAVSRDLIKWQHLAPALAPTLGGFDGDGCFSGCTTLDDEGVPTILYTGVRLRSSGTCGPLPPPECDLGTACIETQCLAFGDPADPKLIHWTKEEVPFLLLPPPNMNLTAWRDPYVIARPGQDGEQYWTVMVGAGVKERGGTALVYKSPTLRGGTWSYVGELCRGRGDTGVIWECPVMLRLARLPPPPSPPPDASSLKQMCQHVQSPLVTPSPNASDNYLLISRSSPIVKPDNAAAAAFTGAEAPSPVLLLPPSIIAMPSPAPASPRPPIKPRPASAADTMPYIGADGILSAEQRLADSTAAALLSPMRRVVQVLPQASISPLRSPARWNLPALTALPHAPSPPAPRPPGARKPADSIVGVFRSPGSTPSTAIRPAASNICSNTAGFTGTRHGYAPPASPRLMQLLPGSSGSVICPGSRALPPYGSLASPGAHARGPASAISALLSTSSPVPTHASRATFVMPPSPPRVKTPPVATEAAAGVADPGAATAAKLSWRRYQTFFCVCPDDCNSMAVYYLGSYDAGCSAFNLDEALGPFPVDLGDIFYAPNALTDPQGRSVLWGWLQEKPRKVGTYDYAGCLSMPRLLSLEVDENSVSDSGGGGNAGLLQPAVHLVQRPPPEIVNLRLPGSEWLASGLLLEPGSTLPVPLASGHHLELELSMMPVPQPLEPLQEEGDMAARIRDNAGKWSGDSPGPSPCGVPGIGFSPRPSPRPDTAAAWVRRHSCSGGSRCSGVLLHNWQSGAEGSAALLYHWGSGVLEVVFEAMDTATLTFSLAAPGARRVGGRLQRPPVPGSPLALRVFLDYSCLEVFTGNGEVLTARVYRGSAPNSSSSSLGYHQRQNLPSPGSSMPSPYTGGGRSAAAGVELVSFGCSTEFLSVGAYEVGSIWEEDV